MTDNREYHRAVEGNGPCRSCGAVLMYPCRTKAGRPTKPHKARIDAYEREVAAVKAQAEERAARARTNGVLADMGLIAPHPVTLIEVECWIVDSALHARGAALITTEDGADHDARDWCARQQDALFARYIIDGREVIGWPTPNGIEWKEPVPA